ncbi:fimbrial protein [Vibrio sp. WXL103]|uniref:fimbrial protein n=1 Tax=unclassified Vibrio TaxID=2614977 RepID=UPI003EC74EDD
MLKKTKISVAISAVSLLSAAVMANDYNETQVNFKGEIVSAACGLAPESMDQTVQLGQHPAHLFTSVGTRTTPVAFGIKLTDCNTETYENATFTFHSNPAPDKPELFGVEGGAEGIGVRILHGGNPIDNGTATSSISLVDGTNIMYFSAAYESTSETVKAGSAESWALLRVEYL